MADLESRALITRPRVVSFAFYIVIGENLKANSIGHLCAEPSLPDAHSESLWPSRDRLVETLSGRGFFPDGAVSFPSFIVENSKAKSIGHLCAETFLPDAHSESLWASPVWLVEPLGGRGFFPDGDLLAEDYASGEVIHILSNQGKSSGSGSGSGSGTGSGSGGGAGEGRNGGNQGVGGGGQREGIGNERRGNRGSNHGGANGGGDDDGDDRGGWVGYIGGERGPMGPGPLRWEEIQLGLNSLMIGTLESFDIRDLPAKARIYRVVSFAFNLVALVVLSASIRQRRTSPRLASILSWIGSFATLLGFISMIVMAFWASLILWTTIVLREKWLSEVEETDLSSK